MQQHLIAIDLDGTTLNNQSKLSPLTRQCLRKLDEMGHLIAIVTGRPYRTSIGLYQELGITSPMVNFNGAYCCFPQRPAWTAAYHYDLDRSIALELLKRQDSLNVNLICAEGIDRLYSSSMNLPDSPYYPKEETQLSKLTRSSLTKNPTALTLFSSEDQQTFIKQQIENKYSDQVAVRTWGGEFPVLEVVRAGINKAVGVKAIADFYHIPRESIYAFGDEDNDREMIEYAGHGVAMANAIELIKNSADEITDFTNDQDGLAKHLIKAFDLKILS
ncbi:haloacid dehalogenase [Facklamia sp. HMSC062C11]|uniref:Cof-type HAD-IIB family hydrolase n=1 Tax=Facklamia hominis TaxID=178214 RepID=A0AAJ1Q5F0_9LACT|nr:MULTISPECIES: Cof-type HAD-IIB family hydrolase [Facklamia]MDK7187172.1 Cof-type HAD-IIB family hydrolase [Facklamia hominis]OFL65118.1 haloacid dehalogenase [Facklamia sp. HMSC062C11]